MAKTLVVVYSYTGTSRLAADLLCAQRGWPLGVITDASPRRGSLRCIIDSLLRVRPDIRYEGPDPADFHTVVLVSPIWMQRLAGPMRSFVGIHAHRLPRVAVVSLMASKGAPNAVDEISRLTRNVPVLACAFTAKEVNDGSLEARLEGFGRALESAQAARPDLGQDLAPVHAN